MFTRALHKALFWATSIQSIPPHPISIRCTYILILLVVSFILPFPQISYKHSSSPHLCYMPRPYHPPSRDHSDYTWWRVVTKLLVLQFLPTSYFISHLLSTLFLNTLSPCSSLNVRDQISHPYRTISKIIVLYILIFKYLDSIWEDKNGSGLNGSRYYKKSISS
jgi:hypothetical protein